MQSFAGLLINFWLNGALLIAAVALGLLGLRRRQSAGGKRLGLCALALLLLGASGLALPKAWSIGLLLAGSALFLCLFLLLIWNGSWWRPAAYAAAVLLLAGIGGTVLASAQDFLVEAGRVSLGLRPTKPWWLLALLLAPLIVVWSYRSLASLGPVRRWIAIGLRCLLIVLLTLALAEVRSTRH